MGSTLVAVLAMALMTACGSGGTRTGALRWDLSGSHDLRDVDWPKPDLTALELQPEGNLSITLPWGRTFTAAAADIGSVVLARDGNRVTKIDVDSPPVDATEAESIARRWSGDAALKPTGLEAWRRRTAADGATPSNVVAQSDQRIGGGGPYASVEIGQSFDDGRPHTVTFQLLWGSG